MTDNEIIKAIEYCSADKIVHCEDCPFYEKCLNDENLFKYAFDLINRQKAEIELLKEINKKLSGAVDWCKVKEEKKHENKSSDRVS